LEIHTAENVGRPVNIFSRFRKFFIAGIATLFPIFITVYIFILIFRFTDNVSGKYINAFIFSRFGFKIPGLGFVLTLLIILLVGILSSHFLGKRLLPGLEKIFLKVPFVNHVYQPAKELANFLFGQHRQTSFKRVVLLRYPNSWSYTIGFITNEGIKEFNEKTGQELVSVLVSTPPSPFSGPIIFVPKKEITLLDITIDQAIKFVVSGGIVSPTAQFAQKEK
jgi:uncharacterized membrane protein